MAVNILGNISLSKNDMLMPTNNIIYLLLHEANHSKQLARKFFDKRRFNKQGRMVIELEATLQTIYDMSRIGYDVKDFLGYELNLRLIHKYGVDLPEFVSLTKQVIKMAEKDNKDKELF